MQTIVAPGHWRIGLAAAYGTVDASHVATCPEVAPECATETIPPHRHHVGTTLTHTEVTAEYGLRPGAQLTLRLPYDVKAQRVRYTTLGGGPFTPPYGDIHHRSETLQGVSDASLLVELAPRDGWMAGFGTTFPLGRIEPDPIRLGEEGKAHEHLQFGSGTLQPKLALQWLRRGSRASLFARAEATLSVATNREGFRGPSTLLWSFGPSLRRGKVSFDPRLDGQYQSQGRWHGVVDENSGFHDGGVRLQLSLPWRSVIVSPSIRRQLWSRSLAEEQAFRQRWTAALALTMTR